MTFRLIAAVFLILLLVQGRAMAGFDASGDGPPTDPLEFLRMKPPPDDHTNENNNESIISAPAKPKPPPVRKELPRNDKPMEGLTDKFDRKEFIAGEGTKEAHVLIYFLKAPPEPKKGAGDSAYPLVVVLHDYEGVAYPAEALADDKVSKDFPAFIAVPVLAPGKLWAFPDKFPDDDSLAYLGGFKLSLPDVIELVNSLAEDYPIDRRRIYLVGCAEGGFGAFGAAFQYPKVFAGIVPINGGWAIKEAPWMISTPLLVLHGEDDDKFKPKLSRDLAYYIQKLGGDVSYVSFPGVGHECSDDKLYSRTVWEWLFKQRRSRKR